MAVVEAQSGLDAAVHGALVALTQIFNQPSTPLTLFPLVDAFSPVTHQF
jgi:hypothetical protein